MIILFYKNNSPEVKSTMNKLKILIISLLVLFISSCGVIKEIPIETIYNYKDSTVVNMVDSIVYTPIYEVKNIVPVYDTLHLETDLAKAEAYVDTTIHMLKGNIKNKKDQQVKYVYRDRIQYRDSIQIKEVPVEVQVEKIIRKAPWYNWILWPFAIFGLVSILLLAIKIYLKFYGVK